MSALPAVLEAVRLVLDDAQQVSALWLLPPEPRAVLALAHGAGAGMTHPFLEAIAEGLAARGVATLRYQFPYMERGSRRPDPARVAKAVVRTAAAEAGRRLPGLPLFAGGKSFGARMSSEAQASEPLPGVRGLVFVGFPLHPAGEPSLARADHLAKVAVPMLFLQGTRDELADLALVRQVADRLGRLATLKALAGADHAFHVLVRSGRNDAQVLEELLDSTAAWIDVVRSAR